MAHDPDVNPYPDNAPQENSAHVAELDRTARFPVLFFFTAGLFWLFVGAAIGMLAYHKFRHPDFLGGDIRQWFGGALDFIPRAWVDLAEPTSWGRLKPAFHHVLMYGWACSGAMGTALWIMSRMTRAKIPFPGVIVVAGHLWHFGVLWGLLQICFSGPRSFEWLEMSGATSVILLLAYLPIAFAAFYMLLNRVTTGKYLAIYYLAGALFWFPWVFGLANLLLRTGVVTGVMLPVINFWYMDAFAVLFLAAIALGTAYYLVPNITGRALNNYAYGLLAFWAIAFLGGVLGLRHLAGFPIQTIPWVSNLSVAFGLLMAVPALLIAAQFLKPVQLGYGLFGQSVPLRFVVIGLCAFFVTHTVGAFLSMDFVERYTQFTIATDGHFYLFIYAFPTFVFFGAIYYIMPKVLGYEWHSTRLIEIHYWVTLFATIFLTLFMLAGGAAQGAVLQQPNNTISIVMQQARQVTWMGNLFWTAIVIANALFLYNLLRSLWKVYDPTPAFLASIRPEADHTQSATDTSTEQSAQTASAS